MLIGAISLGSVAAVGVRRGDGLGSDEDPCILPRAAGQVPLDVQPGHALEGPGTGQRSGIDRSEADRLDDIEDGLLRRGIIARDVAVRGDSADLRIGLARLGPISLAIWPIDWAYLRWDGLVPHDAESIGEEPGSMLIVRLTRHGEPHD